MNRIRHTLLQLILNRRSPEQEQIILDQLRRLIQRLPTPVDRRRSLAVHSRPLPVLLLGHLSRRDAERSQPLRSVVLEVDGAAAVQPLAVRPYQLVITVNRGS